MKFDLVVNLERLSDSTDMRDVLRHVTQLVEMADEGGFATAWAAEHHALEMTIAPSPFQLLTHWAARTSRIRLGTAVVVAPYWHPIKLAGEAALFDLLSGGGSSSVSGAAPTSGSSTASRMAWIKSSARPWCAKCCPR